MCLAVVVAAGAGSCMGRSGKNTAAGSPAAAPKQYGYKVVTSYPHDPKAYTQGLLWYEGCLYESTGMNGLSSLRRVDLSTGRVRESRTLGDEYFAEGLALHEGVLYQLTWRNGRAFTYNLDGLEPAGEFSYRGEGWGLAGDGDHLYMSDGSDLIRVLEPLTWRTVRTFQVTSRGTGVQMLNELEWVGGELWANVYMTDQIVRINPVTGEVTGVIDLAGLLPVALATPDTDVLNGIAYDPATGRIFVTGKNWSRLFEIELVEKLSI